MSVAREECINFPNSRQTFPYNVALQICWFTGNTEPVDLPVFAPLSYKQARGGNLPSVLNGVRGKGTQFTPSLPDRSVLHCFKQFSLNLFLIPEANWIVIKVNYIAS